MRIKIFSLVLAMIALDIIDGDFGALSVLDFIKAALYVICLALLADNYRNRKTEGEK